MEKEQFEKLIATLESLAVDVPSTDLYDVEQKLDRLIELNEKQLDVFETISDQLQEIRNEIPRETHVSTSGIESGLSLISTKIEDSNSYLNDIAMNTSG